MDGQSLVLPCLRTTLNLTGKNMYFLEMLSWEITNGFPGQQRENTYITNFRFNCLKKKNVEAEIVIFLPYHPIEKLWA